MIEAVIFDMDGLLIDSEPFWLEAQREMFPLVGIQITDDVWKETLGIRNKEVVDLWYAKNPWDLNKVSKRELDDKIVTYVIDLIYRKGEPMEGVGEILAFFQKQKVKMALASSSDFKMIDAVIDRLKLEEYFEVIHSAEMEQYGKPHPAVFSSTATKLSVLPSRCLAIEDSLNGLLAAKAAQMKCVIVPGDPLKNDRRLGMADVVLNSLREFDESIWERFN